MRMIISSILVIVFHELFTRVADVSSQSTGNNCTKTSLAVEDQGSVYSGVKMFFGDSFCQRIIQEDVTNAVKNACMGTTTPERPSDDYKALTSRIDFLDKKVGDLLQRLGALVLCTSKNVACPKGYEYYQPGKFWYKFHSECRNWIEARQICQQEVGDLIILNENNFDFFRNVSKSKAGDCKQVWVGATDMHSNGTWKWLNGEEVKSVFWGPAQPDNRGNETCGDLSSSFDYKLNDHVCSYKEHFICQIV